MNDFQKAKFKKLFTITSDSFDSKGVLLKKVLDLEPNRCDEDLELSYDDFKEYLYVNGISSVESNLVRLKTNIEKGIKFHYLHSYAKNGKTTFLRRFVEENKDKLVFVVVNFKDFQLSRIDLPHSILSKSLSFLNTMGSVFKDEFVDTLQIVLRHIEENQIEVKVNTIANEFRTDYNFLFHTFRGEFTQFLEHIVDDSRNQSPAKPFPKWNLFSERFNDFVGPLINSNKVNPIELFNFILLVAIKLYGKQNKKLIFIFDNIDDILTNSSEYLTSRLFPQTHTFYSIIRTYINHKNRLLDDEILDNIFFIYSYRTANYVSSMFHLNYNPSANSQKQALLSAPLYRISSIKHAHKIVRKKLDFYDTLCQAFSIEQAKAVNYLQSLISAIETGDSTDNSTIFRLWNGNHYAFVEWLKTISISDNDYYITTNNKIPNYIKLGTLIFHIVNYYTRNRAYHLIPESSIVSAFQYSFTLEDCDDNDLCRCNFLRLFLSYIINYNENNPLSKNDSRFEAGTVIDKGVSLKELLDKFSQFQVNGNPIYSKDNFNELFSRIFLDDIDEFDYFITCVKNTDIHINNSTFFGKKYDFSEEIDLYFKYYKSDTSKLQSLNSIKIYDNQNSKYFLNKIKKHFEFYSCYLIDDSVPLSFNLKVIRSIPEKEVFDDIEFEFNYIVNNLTYVKTVYGKVAKTMKAITRFYINYILAIYPPTEYCNSSYFALNKSFHFADLISKHITYLNQVRLNVIGGNIPFEYQKDLTSQYVKSTDLEVPLEIIQNINGRFIYWIEMYINLFYENFKTIKEAAIKIDKQMDKHSKNTRKEFDKLMEQIRAIKNSNFTDTSIKIEN
jgi:hypothetical protein